MTYTLVIGFLLTSGGSVTEGFEVLQYEQKIRVTSTMTKDECEKKLIQMRKFINKRSKAPGMYCKENK